MERSQNVSVATNYSFCVERKTLRYSRSVYDSEPGRNDFESRHCLSLCTDALGKPIDLSELLLFVLSRTGGGCSLAKLIAMILFNRCIFIEIR